MRRATFETGLIFQLPNLEHTLMIILGSPQPSKKQTEAFFFYRKLTSAYKNWTQKISKLLLKHLQVKTIIIATKQGSL